MSETRFGVFRVAATIPLDEPRSPRAHTRPSGARGLGAAEGVGTTRGARGLSLSTLTIVTAGRILTVPRFAIVLSFRGVESFEL